MVVRRRRLRATCLGYFQIVFAVRAGIIMHNMRTSVMMWIIITQWPLVHGAVKFRKWTFPRVLWDWQHNSSVTLGNVQWTFPRVVLFMGRTFPRVREHLYFHSQSTRGNVHDFFNIKGWRHRALWRLHWRVIVQQ